jgi:hypothetical protein
VPLLQHSAKNIGFAKHLYSSTQQSAYTLPNADLGHSAKSIIFAECPYTSTRQRAGLGARQTSGFIHRHVYFFAESRIRLSAKSLPNARQKTLGKEAFSDPFFAVSSLPSATLGKFLPNAYVVLPSVLDTLQSRLLP